MGRSGSSVDREDIFHAIREIFRFSGGGVTLARTETVGGYEEPVCRGCRENIEAAKSCDTAAYPRCPWPSAPPE